MAIRTADHDFEARVRASFAAQRAMYAIGARLTLVEPGHVELHLEHRGQLTQQHGFLHAGILSTGMDSACGYAAFSLMPADAAVLTIEYKVNLLRPADAAGYRIDAHVVRAGKTITVAQALAYPDGGSDPVATMTATLIAVVGATIRH